MDTGSSIKADLHSTTLSHTTNLRQAYDMTQDLHDNGKRVVGLIYKKQFISQASRTLVVCDKVVPCNNNNNNNNDDDDESNNNKNNNSNNNINNDDDDDDDKID